MTLVQAINQVFDKYRGCTVVTPVVVALSLQALEVTPANYASKEKVVRRKLRSMVRKGELVISSGKGGGLKRVSDMTDRETKIRAIDLAIKHLKAAKRELQN